MTLREFVTALDRNSQFILTVRNGEDAKQWDSSEHIILKDWRDLKVLCIATRARKDGWTEITVHCK